MGIVSTRVILSKLRTFSFHRLDFYIPDLEHATADMCHPQNQPCMKEQNATLSFKVRDQIARVGQVQKHSRPTGISQTVGHSVKALNPDTSIYGDISQNVCRREWILTC